MTTSTRAALPERDASQRERRPFLYLVPEPASQYAAGAIAAGLPAVVEAVGDGAQSLARAVVDYTIGADHERDWPICQPVSHAVLNRRRRVAGLWVQAILGGRVDPDTLRSLVQHWIPQLAGTGPEVARAVPRGEACVEYLRGALTARIADVSSDNLVPTAKALHAVDAVLAAHLAALRAAALQPAETR